MLNLLLLRHGQTEANKVNTIQGHDDTPLTAQGITDTYQKAEKLKIFNIDAIYCSDLKRATHTLKLIKECLPTLPEAVYIEQLREINFGEYSGRLKDEIMPIILRHKANKDMKYPGGESGNDLTKRVTRFVDGCVRRHKNETVLAVTHYGVMETVLRQYTDHPEDQPVKVGDDKIYMLAFDNRSNAIVDVI